MLVYFVNHSSAPVNLGGAERSMIALVEDWYAADPDFEAVFITKAPRGKFIDAIEERGWEYRAFPYRGWTIPKQPQPAGEAMYFAKHDYRAVQDIIAMMEQRRPDLVVTNTVVAPWGAFAAAVLGIPQAWFVREYGDLDHGLAFQTSRAQTFADIGLFAGAVFTNSLALREHIAQYLPEGKRVDVVYPQVDLERIERRAAESPAVAPFAAGAGLKLAIVGRLSKTKGQWRAIAAVAELKARGVRADLVLVGGYERAGYDVELRTQATTLGVGDRVRVVGEQANPMPFVAAADVCVTASGIEAFGRTTLEYMAAGKAVVASAGGGSAELVIDGETGFLFLADEVEALASRLEQYVLEPELIAAHGAAARKRAAEISGPEFGNAAAIERLKEVAAEPAYRLPQIARHWFALPGLFADSGGGARAALSVIASRLPGRLRSGVVAPIAAARRRAGGAR